MCSLVCLLVIGRDGNAAKIVKESEVKAAFIYKFLLFTDFPDMAFSDTPDELSICIYGINGINEINGIKSAFDPVEGKSVKGRTLRIRSIRAQSGRSALKDCHILFIGADNTPDTTKQILSTLKGAPILTIGEHEDFLKWGGMIRLYMDSGRIAFDVNADSAKLAGFSFRAQMLRIAKRVME